MIESVIISQRSQASLYDFLIENNFSVERIDKTIFKITRHEEFPVFITATESTVYFELDLGNISRMATKDLYFDLLDLNTNILPVSLGIDTSNSEDPRLVLVESRELSNLDDNELLSVLDALELAVDKVEDILSKYLK